MSLLKKILACTLSLLLLCSSVSAAGDAADPVISQSYLESVFSGAFLKDVSVQTKAAADALEAQTLCTVEQQLAQSRMSSELRYGASGNGSGSIYTARDDRLSTVLGTKITPADGTLTAETSGWVDITIGAAVQSGASMVIGHTYLSTEDQCSIRTNSIAGCVSFHGGYTIRRSGETDYASRAQALSALGLFQGGTTGFELNRAATRTEALVMFLRILGLEDEALKSTAINPFWDIPSWASSYAAYAYEQGLALGRGNGTYDANASVTVQDYLTFLLRALGYREGAEFAWATALDDAVRLGVLTSTERTELQNSTFTRAQMVYLSWQALMSQNSSGQLLLCQLRDEGTVTRSQVAAAIRSICGGRMS